MWYKQENIFNKHHAQVPVVDSFDTFYRIYYSTRTEGKSIPMFIDIDKNTFELINESTQPLLSLGQPGLFDWSGIMPTEIITLENGIKYLYYIGWSRRIDVPYHNNLGLAISTDNGITWNKYSNGPVFHTSSKEPGYIGTVDILVENGVWKMWYLSCREWVEHKEIMEPIYDIKYATSQDGINWEPTNQICIPLENNEGGISAMRVVKIGSTYKAWFSVRNKFDYRINPENSYRVKTATSSDGINWTRNSYPDLDISSQGWDSEMVAYPYIIKEENKLIMFYNGNQFGKTGIGYATTTI